MTLKNLAIFASGGGSNTQKIMDYFEGHPELKIALVVSNKTEAGVLERAQKQGVPTKIIPKSTWLDAGFVLETLKTHQIEGIILAGFLLQIPTYLVQAYPHKIINIHPALLPKFGGKGMYGMYVHQAVKQAGASETGITIHEVNEVYDDGKIIFQASCNILPSDDPEAIAHKVQLLEHAHFPRVIESYFKA
jgi:phosphoribosylglycinamide formyltransferase-1